LHASAVGAVGAAWEVLSQDGDKLQDCRSVYSICGCRSVCCMSGCCSACVRRQIAGAPVAVAVGGHKVGVDDGQREHNNGEGVQVEHEGLVDDPTHKDHERQHEDRNLRRRQPSVARGSMLRLQPLQGLEDDLAHEDHERQRKDRDLQQWPPSVRQRPSARGWQVHIQTLSGACCACTLADCWAHAASGIRNLHAHASALACMGAPQTA